MARQSGWEAMFWTAFKRSRNAMALLDEERRAVEVNPACLRMMGYRRQALIGHPMYEFVVDGPRFTQAEWRAMMERDDFTVVLDLICESGEEITVQVAGHPETATGKRLMLVVVLSTARAGRRIRDGSDSAGPVEALSSREQEVVRLIGDGATGPEIAEELQISHNTVRTHAFNAMTKLNARSRAHLVAKALAGGHAHLQTAAA